MSVPKEPKNTKGVTNKFDKVNKVLGPGFVALDTYMNIKEGDNVPVALGKAMLLNAAWELAPGGLVGGLAIGAGMVATQMAPVVGAAIDQKASSINQYKQNFSNASHYQSSQAQRMLASQGINQIRNAQLQATRQMANHARNAQRVY